ncbi:hypothetical protein Tco_0705577 [Tanacetum coccineum]|uniref:Uncharacterized protein n=1 Tax=Tanacetum coccineum TaxID=301880 RepID=A0ABQ4Y6C4_9ASTR
MDYWYTILSGTKVYLLEVEAVFIYENKHYDAGGNGWWDSDMEDIDNEAVGSNEVWEGVRPATMGGLDWH